MFGNKNTDMEKIKMVGGEGRKVRFSWLKRLLRLEKKDANVGAKIIPIERAREKRSGKGNEFKPEMGKEKCMTEYATVEEEYEAKIKALTKELEDLKKKNVPEDEFISKIIKRTESEIDIYKHKLYGNTREEMYKRLESMATDFNMLKPLLNLPERIFVTGMARYSERRDTDSIYAAHMLRMFQPELPDWSELVFSFGLADSTMQSYFCYCDPKNKILLVAPLLYLGEGSWSDVASDLKEALEHKDYLDRKGQKYNYILSKMGTIEEK